MPQLINTVGSQSASTLMHLFSKDKHTHRGTTQELVYACFIYRN